MQLSPLFHLYIYFIRQFFCIHPSIAALPPGSAHLITSPSPSPRPPTPYPPPRTNNQKRKGVESAEGGRGWSPNQQKEKWEDPKSAKERRRGWTLISWPQGTNPIFGSIFGTNHKFLDKFCAAPKLTQTLILPSLHPGLLVWEMKFATTLNFNILFCIICPLDDADIKAI